MINIVCLTWDLTFQEHMASYSVFSIQSPAAVNFSFSHEHLASQFLGFKSGSRKQIPMWQKFSLNKLVNILQQLCSRSRNTGKDHSELDDLIYELFKNLSVLAACFQLLLQNNDGYYRNLLLSFFCFHSFITDPSHAGILRAANNRWVL